jgi:hypothetical protein
MADQLRKDKAALQKLQEQAKEMLLEKVPYLERLVLLRAQAQAQGLTLRDKELWSMFAAARKDLRGAGDGVTSEMELDIPEDSWIWELMICAATLNVVVALQKVGKTALMLQMIRLWAAGAGAFLGGKLIGPCPPVIIVGTDMPLTDWRSMLTASGLMERTTSGKWRLLPPIVRLWHRGDPLHIDEEGIERLTTICEAHPGALLLVDSYAAVTAPLGIEESKPEAAEPLYGLCEAVEPYGITTVMIHHSSKSRADERASNAARGSNAITATASQMLSLKWHSEKEEDHRVDLSTEGRGSRPQHLVIEQIERCSWVLHGDTAEVRRSEGRTKAEDGLTDRQSKALAEVRDLWDEKCQEMDSVALRDLLPAEYSQGDARRAANDTLEQLYRKALLEKRTISSPERGKVNLYRPFDTDITEAKLSPRAGVSKQPPDPPCSPDPLMPSQRNNPSLYSPKSSINGRKGGKGPPAGHPRARGAIGSPWDINADGADPHWG